MSSVAHSISGQSSQSEKKSLSHHESVINPAFRQRMEKLTAVREDTENERDSEYGKIPAPSHRHAGPSAPWPWVNIDDEADEETLNSFLPPVPPPCDHSSCSGHCWREYPQSRFPNWIAAQLERSKIRAAIQNTTSATISSVVINKEAKFFRENDIVVDRKKREELWGHVKRFQEKETRPHLRVLFFENMSGDVLQMLGGGFNIEPFFFSSSINRIPSRYQEDATPAGDHITIVMTFIRSRLATESQIKLEEKRSERRVRQTSVTEYNDLTQPVKQMETIDTHSPLILRSPDATKAPRQINQDLFAVHLIRNVKGNLLISYHPSDGHHSNGAKYLPQRLQLAGRSVYWQTIMRRSYDPTFALLILLWHALYSWDEALEQLYEHICSMELRVMTTNDMEYTRELHVLRAHLLHYHSLLEDFRKTINFISSTRHPAFDPEYGDNSIFGPSGAGANDQDEGEHEGLYIPTPSSVQSWMEQKQVTQRIMEAECNTLLNEIERLEMGRLMQDKRLKNVINLVFSSVTIEDSKQMQEMTQAAARDSAAMKQIAYLSMIFLPSSFVAAIFGMNVDEISPGTKGTLPHFFAIALTMTFVTIWIVVAFQSTYFYKPGTPLIRRLVWPIDLSFIFVRSRVPLLRRRLRRAKSEEAMV